MKCCRGDMLGDTLTKEDRVAIVVNLGERWMPANNLCLLDEITTIAIEVLEMDRSGLIVASKMEVLLVVGMSFKYPTTWFGHCCEKECNRGIIFN